MGDYRGKHRSGRQLELDVDELAELDRIRPKTRSECRDGLRPCPFVACVHHMAVDVGKSKSIHVSLPGWSPRNGKRRSLPDRASPGLAAEWTSEIADAIATTQGDTCSLDVADRGGQTLLAIGEKLGVTRERIRQIEVRGLRRMKRSTGRHGIRDDD